MNNIVGYWAQHIIFYSHMEEESIAFLPDGTGYLMWENLFYEQIDVFRWTITDGKLTLIGYKQVIFREDDLTEISPSNLNVEEIAFKIEKREAIDGEIVDALVFADSLRFMSDSQYGLVSKDVKRFGNYRKLKELLSSGIDEQ